MKYCSGSWNAITILHGFTILKKIFITCHQLTKSKGVISQADKQFQTDRQL